jgi:hypothetical protein
VTAQDVVVCAQSAKYLLQCVKENLLSKIWNPRK